MRKKGVIRVLAFGVNITNGFAVSNSLMKRIISLKTFTNGFFVSNMNIEHILVELYFSNTDGQSVGKKKDKKNN